MHHWISKGLRQVYPTVTQKYITQTDCVNYTSTSEKHHRYTCYIWTGHISSIYFICTKV